MYTKENDADDSEKSVFFCSKQIQCQWCSNSSHWILYQFEFCMVKWIIGSWSIIFFNGEFIITFGQRHPCSILCSSIFLTIKKWKQWYRRSSCPLTGLGEPNLGNVHFSFRSPQSTPERSFCCPLFTPRTQKDRDRATITEVRGIKIEHGRFFTLTFLSFWMMMIVF